MGKIIDNLIPYPDNVEKMCRRSQAKGKVYTEDELINAKIDEAPDTLWQDIAATIARSFHGEDK